MHTPWSIPTSREQQTRSVSDRERQKVLVFSPDSDLAKSLSMLLENQFEIICETKLENLAKRIGATLPALMLIDLYAFPSDILKETQVIRGSRTNIPIILLRAYRPLSEEVESAIRDVADLVLYKPLDVNSVAGAIHQLLETH